MTSITSTLPLLVPGSVVAAVLAVVLSGAVGRWLGVHRSVAFVLLVTVGVILAVTLSPQDLQGTHDFRIAGSCDLSRMWPPSLSELQLETDAAANVLIFIPVGVAIGLAPWSRRKVGVLLAAIALPFAIEAVQFAVTPLGRACQSADVVDNLTGLLVGLVAGTIVLVAGTIVAWLVPALQRRDRSA